MQDLKKNEEEIKHNKRKKEQINSEYNTITKGIDIMEL
ncbi:hypothetical protein LCGC14_2758830 [marine sediment metagenome]|uniref:Uncharacterized protein n=1 Tax=marine sediment metagenome TaxID=412755 RepID=A0A0F8YZP0_9ZZZZ